MFLSSFKDALDSCEIYSALKKHKNTKNLFVNVFSWDTIPLKLPKNGFSFVCNLSKSRDPGTHWIAAFSDGETLEIFDSFALIRKRLPNSKLEKLSKTLKLKIRVNKKRLQSYYTDACGYYCIAYIIFKSKGCQLSRFNRQFSPLDFTANDLLVKRAVKPLLRKSAKIRHRCYRRYVHACVNRPLV